MGEPRFGSVLALVRLLAGATPVTRESPALTAALERLKTTSDQEEAERLDRMIWRLWNNGGNRMAVRALGRGLDEMALGDLAAARISFDQAIAADATFAEAWNRRATLYFLRGEQERSVADIERVLVLEPRHYGALSGLGQVLLRLGDQDGALVAFEAALAVNPHMNNVRALAECLRQTQPDRRARRPLLH